MAAKYTGAMALTVCLGVASLILIYCTTNDYRHPTLSIAMASAKPPAEQLIYNHNREHELARMRLMENLEDMFDYVKSEKFQQEEKGRLGLEDFENRYRAVMLQMKSLEINDNADHWKEKEHNALSDLIQRRISYLQNPKSESKTDV